MAVVFRAESALVPNVVPTTTRSPDVTLLVRYVVSAAPPERQSGEGDDVFSSNVCPSKIITRIGQFPDVAVDGNVCVPICIQPPTPPAQPPCTRVLKLIVGGRKPVSVPTGGLT